MEVRFADAALDRTETDASSDGAWPTGIASVFRKRMQFIRAAADERAFYGMRSLRFEKLKGARSHQYSMRLNDQWRLIIEFEGEGPRKVVVVMGIEDYH